MARRLLSILVGAMAGLIVVLLSLRFGWLGAPPQTFDPHLLPAPFPAPELVLTTHQGEEFTLQPSRVVTILFFGYASCPDVCPLTLAKLTRVVEAMGSQGKNVQVLFVTVDPGRDTVAHLSDYMSAFHPSFLGLTGRESQIAETAEAWGVFRYVPAGESGYVVDHTARSFVVDQSLRFRATIPPDAAIQNIVRTLRSVLDG